MTDVIEFPIDITKLEFKKTKKCCKCLIIKDSLDFYSAGGCCKLCRKYKYKEKSLNTKKSLNIEKPQRLYYQNINGEKILLTEIDGNKICCRCLINKNAKDFYSKGGCCKTCTLMQNKQKYNQDKKMK